MDAWMTGGRKVVSIVRQLHRETPMPNTKAQYTGDDSGSLITDFTEGLKAGLRAFYTNKDAKADAIWGCPADDFVAAVLNEAHWAKATLHWQRHEVTNAEIRAEHADLLKVLTDGESKLRRLSPDFARILSIDADPIGVANQLTLMIKALRDAAEPIRNLGRQKKFQQKQNDVAVELAVRVLRVLTEYEIKPSATATPDYDTASDAVKILKLIGDDMKFVKAETTWRDIIAAANKKISK